MEKTLKDLKKQVERAGYVVNFQHGISINEPHKSVITGKVLLNSVWWSTVRATFEKKKFLESFILEYKIK